MLVNMVAPHIGPLVRDLVIFPLKARLKLRTAVSQVRHSDAVAAKHACIGPAVHVRGRVPLMLAALGMAAG